MTKQATRFSIRLPARTLARLKRAAKRNGVTVSDIVRAALTLDPQTIEKKKSRRAPLA